MDYAEAFFTDPGRCFRWIYSPTINQPMRCPEPVTSRGVRATPKGKRYEVDACEGHRGQLKAVANWE